MIPLDDPQTAAARIAAGPFPGLACGLARSYGDACLNPAGTLWLTHGLDRFAAFDPGSGELECEAGVSLGNIQDTFVPQGWMLPVSPGTSFVTVGGAIANDVHGKNHHVECTFGAHVKRLLLLRTDGRSIECGPDVERDWFAATLGGLGLTGVIARATLQLRRVPGPWLETQTLPFERLDGFFELADASEADWEYTVAWVDCLAAKGRGLFMRGRHAAGAPLRRREQRRVIAVPFEPPFSLVNKATLRLFNAAYFRMHRRNRKCGFEHYSGFFYPLDNLLRWNLMYGPRGFYQYQCVVPHAVRLDATLAMLDAISRSGDGSFLAVLKTFGERRSPGLLSFPMHGVTLALDFANAGERTLRLFERLDAIVREAGGRIYPAKDARMPRDLFESGYPALAEFGQFRDRGISSQMSRRLMGD